MEKTALVNAIPNRNNAELCGPKRKMIRIRRRN